MEITYNTQESYRAKRLLDLATLLQGTREDLFEQILKLDDHKGQLSIYLDDKCTLHHQKQILEICRDIWNLFNEYEVQLVITKDMGFKQYQINNLKGFQDFRIAKTRAEELANQL